MSFKSIFNLPKRSQTGAVTLIGSITPTEFKQTNQLNQSAPSTNKLPSRTLHLSTKSHRKESSVCWIANPEFEAALEQVYYQEEINQTKNAAQSPKREHTDFESVPCPQTVVKQVIKRPIEYFQEPIEDEKFDIPEEELTRTKRLIQRSSRATNNQSNEQLGLRSEAATPLSPGTLGISRLSRHVSSSDASPYESPSLNFRNYRSAVPLSELSTAQATPLSFNRSLNDLSISSIPSPSMELRRRQLGRLSSSLTPGTISRSLNYTGAYSPGSTSFLSTLMDESEISPLPRQSISTIASRTQPIDQTVSQVSAKSVSFGRTQEIPVLLSPRRHSELTSSAPVRHRRLQQSIDQLVSEQSYDPPNNRPIKHTPRPSHHLKRASAFEFEFGKRSDSSDQLTTHSSQHLVKHSSVDSIQLPYVSREVRLNQPDSPPESPDRLADLSSTRSTKSSFVIDVRQST